MRAAPRCAKKWRSSSTRSSCSRWSVTRDSVRVLTGEVTVTDAMGQKVFKAGGSVTTRVAVSYLIPEGADVTTFVK
jgi:hypothetical protein